MRYPRHYVLPAVRTWCCDATNSVDITTARYFSKYGLHQRAPELAEGKCGKVPVGARGLYTGEYSRIHTLRKGVPDRKGNVAERRQDRRLDLFGTVRTANREVR